MNTAQGWMSEDWNSSHLLCISSKIFYGLNEKMLAWKIFINCNVQMIVVSFFIFLCCMNSKSFPNSNFQPFHLFLSEFLSVSTFSPHLVLSFYTVAKPEMLFSLLLWQLSLNLFFFLKTWLKSCLFYEVPFNIQVTHILFFFILHFSLLIIYYLIFAYLLVYIMCFILLRAGILTLLLYYA